ncbi:KamA family radical SAM protein [PVC group bacterium]|nr:KamA family radical SAM protein [PVC group bacterium]
MSSETIEKNSPVWKHISEDDWNNWRWQISNSLSGDDLLTQPDICFAAKEELRVTFDRYRFRVTPYYLSLANRKDPKDPILKQCIPDIRELSDSFSTDNDPFAEGKNMPVLGLIHRFRDRVLLMASTSCAVYCRHCTRKNMLEKMCSIGALPDYDAIHYYLSNHSEVREVIISGGDPLLLEEGKLANLLEVIRSVTSVEVIRIGTRVPVVLPMRINERLCTIFKKHRPLWLNTQFNHPVEITKEAVRACRLLQESGIPVSNQSVLLHGVNDSLEIMRDLCTALQRNMIRPYYVFVCDPIKGIDHFRVSVNRAEEIEVSLRESVGGLCMPEFVADLPNEASKRPVRELVESVKENRKQNLVEIFPNPNRNRNPNQ